MEYDNLVHKILNEFTVADAGIGATMDGVHDSSDFYAPGDNRIPNYLGTTTRFGKTKSKKKTNKSKKKTRKKSKKK